MTKINESGMSFGPYPDSHVFHLEKSKSYKRVEQGVKIAEFLLLRERAGGSKPVIWVVEAKSGAPNPESREAFDSYIEEIRAKLLNAFSMGIAARLGRPGTAKDELPPALRKVNLSQAAFRLVLVVRPAKDDWLDPLTRALAKALHPTVKAWQLAAPAVLVLNESLARKRALIR